MARYLYTLRERDRWRRAECRLTRPGLKAFMASIPPRAIARTPDGALVVMAKLVKRGQALGRYRPEVFHAILVSDNSRWDAGTRRWHETGVRGWRQAVLEAGR